MAKRIISWKNEGSTLFCGKVVEGSEVVSYTEKFNLEELYPEFSKFTLVQKYISFYGTKQILADSGSGEKEFSAKMVVAKKKWQDMCLGKVTGERANGTGKAEDKRLAGVAKEAMKAVTLEGLLIKKVLNPGLFTEQDEAKLQEFMIAAAGYAAKNDAEKKAKK
jgi:hypothetical protein